MSEIEASHSEATLQGVTDVWQLLPSGQRQLAESTSACMGEVLQIDAVYLRPVIVESQSGDKQVVVVDTSPNGQHIGKFSTIMERRAADPTWYTVVVDGVRIDPLSAMTEDTYRAMIADAQKRGEPVMPDSVELSHQNGVPWTATMLTGEMLTDEGFIPIASFSSDKVDVVGFNPLRGGISMRVRPAIVIPDPSVGI